MTITQDPTETRGIVDFVPLFKAFCNPTRAQIIEFLLAASAASAR